MAKKKQHKDNSTFKNDPFKATKGFSVLKVKLETKAEKIVPEPVAETEPESFSDVDFNQAMAQLGVEYLTDDETMEELLDGADESELEPAEPVALDNSDEALFLASMGQLDSVFRDSFADDEEHQAAAQPQRMKQLRQGRLRPQATLDLHGSYREEARTKVRNFLQNRYNEGLNTLLIVTGKGKRSPKGEAVVRTDIEKYLSTRASAWVAEWGRAPRQYGGDGALVVFLRRTKK
ncbi:MAG: hypothetical protein B6I36_03050 [Desulfobacteraceae bacterium 4572_35.1]|nr:MAG: hypothetical protein B6I36_03050 [Desulfobacteraceae bacterium 4572_35.1]